MEGQRNEINTSLIQVQLDPNSPGGMELQLSEIQYDKAEEQYRLALADLSFNFKSTMDIIS
jgi:hypothetical protein